MGAELRVAVWQHASALDPATNVAALASVEVPAGADLVILPEASARDFGEPGSDLAPYAEPL
ncbi:MAG TPA: hydrolase, partial [Marmoricola sp.]|nr:hydrolase [Marmoricola sp.]